MKNPFAHAAHLARRFFGALSGAAPPAADDAWAVGFLTASEAELWWGLQHQDRRHSVHVARRFVALMDDPSREAVAAALLHDVGKQCSRLGTVSRVVATIIGPRTDRFRRYHDHERLGADLLRDAGSSPVTIALVEGTSADVATADALRAADDI
ncbi:MAG: hypothetical protein JWL72_3056 [Ilumatobacteraceae bacterium]|nr:hypothetical protein [Ilumatobacteraceae bacterium]